MPLRGYETWTFGKREKDKFETFEMWWIWKRKERIKWINGVSKKEVSERVKEERTLT